VRAVFVRSFHLANSVLRRAMLKDVLKDLSADKYRA